MCEYHHKNLKALPPKKKLTLEPQAKTLWNSVDFISSLYMRNGTDVIGLPGPRCTWARARVEVVASMVTYSPWRVRCHTIDQILNVVVLHVAVYCQLSIVNGKPARIEHFNKRWAACVTLHYVSIKSAARKTSSFKFKSIVTWIWTTSGKGQRNQRTNI